MLCTAVFRSNESLCSEVQQSGGSGPYSAAASPAMSLRCLLVVVLLCAGTQYRESARAGDRGHHGGVSGIMPWGHKNYPRAIKR